MLVKSAPTMAGNRRGNHANPGKLAILTKARPMIGDFSRIGQGNVEPYASAELLEPSRLELLDSVA